MSDSRDPRASIAALVVSACFALAGSACAAPGQETTPGSNTAASGTTTASSSLRETVYSEVRQSTDASAEPTPESKTTVSFDSDPYDLWQLHAPPLIFLNYGTTSFPSELEIKSKATRVFIGSVVSVEVSDYDGLPKTLMTVQDKEGDRYAFYLFRGAVVSPDELTKKIPTGEFVFAMIDGAESAPGFDQATHHCVTQGSCVFTIQGERAFAPLGDLAPDWSSRALSLDQLAELLKPNG